MKNKILIFVIGIMFLCGKAFSQSFTASVSNNPIGLDEQFEISFTFSGQDINNLTNFQAPSFKDFIPLSGPNQSTSMQIINGAVSGSRTFSYYLQARNIGKFTIGSASIVNKDQTLKSNPITIEVVKGSAKPKQNQDQGAQQVSTKEIAENLFIRAIVDRTNVYKGEQVTVVYKLYTRLNISTPQLSKLPSYQGFWSEELDMPQNINFTRENINGKLFNVAVLKKAALFPSQSGELSVTPFELKIPVMIQKKKSGNPFDDFFNDPFSNQTETVDFTAKSNTVKVKVLPLPQTKEESFYGAVGNFSYNASVDKKRVKQNEPVTLKLEISGTGNISLIEPPKFELSSGFEKYDPKSTDQINRGGIVSGKKTFEYLIVPRISGKQEIPSIKFTYFNPQKKEYTTLSSPSFSIEIDKGSGEYAGTGGLTKEEIKLLDQDIRYIKTSKDELHKEDGLLISSAGFWTAVILPFTAFIGLLVWKRREDKLAGNVQLLKNLRAEKIAKSRLKLASKLLKEKNTEKYYEEVSRALIGYLEDKLNLPKSEFTLDAIKSVLFERKIPEEQISEVASTIQKCEFIKYAPVTDGLNEMQNIYNSTSRLIVKLEDLLSRIKRSV
jgi:hypothetical protein